MNEEIGQAIRLRVGPARITLEEAEEMREHSLWQGVINCSCYEMFFAVLALRVFKQTETVDG